MPSKLIISALFAVKTLQELLTCDEEKTNSNFLSISKYIFLLSGLKFSLKLH